MISKITVDTGERHRHFEASNCCKSKVEARILGVRTFWTSEII